MRGSVTDLVKNRGYGCILGEDGCVVDFDEKALVGNWVEYEEQYWGERIRAVKVRPIPSPKVGAAE